MKWTSEGEPVMASATVTVRQQLYQCPQGHEGLVFDPWRQRWVAVDATPAVALAYR